MPPSGYSKEQGTAIVTFLKSCSEALETDGKNKKLDPVQALISECNNIKTILSHGADENISKSVLSLTLSFYEELLKHQPADYDIFSNYVENSLCTTAEIIRAIHVPPIE